jgi:hypothetical protein
MWQTASDFIIFVGWAWQNIIIIVGKIFAPIRYIYIFLKSFISSALGTPIEPESIYAFSDEIKGVFQHIPYWNVLISVLIVGIMILMIMFILKTFLKT